MFYTLRLFMANMPLKIDKVNMKRNVLKYISQLVEIERLKQ